MGLAGGGATSHPAVPVLLYAVRVLAPVYAPSAHGCAYHHDINACLCSCCYDHRCVCPLPPAACERLWNGPLQHLMPLSAWVHAPHAVYCCMAHQVRLGLGGFIHSFTPQNGCEFRDPSLLLLVLSRLHAAPI